MLRIEKSDKAIIIGDGLDVQITDTTITVKAIPFLGGGLGQAFGTSNQTPLAQIGYAGPQSGPEPR